MAKRISGEDIYRKSQTPKKTSIGNSNRSRPLNKHKRRQYKKYN